MDIITSKTNQKIKDLIKLRQKKYRDEEKCFLIEGYHSLEMALKYHLVEEIYTIDEKDVYKGIKTYLITREILDKITTSINAQGIVAKCKMKESKEILSDKVVYLDNISDPGNLGTILRTCLAFNYRDVILSSDSVSLYNEKVLSSTQGAVFDLNIIEGDIELLKKLKNEGYYLLGTSLKSSVKLNEINKCHKMVVIFGNEGRGVKNEILDICDKNVIIDIQNIDSLNVGVASGIILYHLK